MPSPPIAEFTASPTSGTEPLMVAFTDTSTNTPTSWAWTFGDGGTSSVQSPSHEYTRAGTYTVALTATNADGSSTATKTDLITVTQRAPVANADSYTTAEDQALSVPSPGVLANDNAVVSGTTVTADVGPTHGTLVLDADGSFSYAPAANYYGTDTFTYTAATGTAASAPATVTITVTNVNDLPTAAFTFSPTAPTVGDAIAFADGSSDPDGTITGWSWDFGDGATSSEQNPDHAYAAAGTYPVALTVTDDGGAEASTTVPVAVTLPPAPAVNAGGPYTGQEGSAVTLTATVSTSATIAKYEWDFNGDSVYDHRTTTPSTEYTWNDVYTGIIGVRATDVHGQTGTDTATVAIANVAPTVSGVTVHASPAAVGTAVAASATFTHPGTGTTIATWTWDDGATSFGTVTAGSVAGTHTYSAPGVYEISVTVADDDGGSGSATAQTFVVVYDPNGGFVTGGGWIQSPAGAYIAEPSLSGKTSFSFVSKYQKGATVPTGSIQFETAGISFQSTRYQWLVIAGSKAQFKGSGTVNGAGDYGFMLTAVDGSPDLLRLKVWEKGTDAVVYDNQKGAADDEGPTTVIGGGSIVVHRK